jgi:hypothetical protein
LPLAVMNAGYFGSVPKNHYVALLPIHDQITKAAVYASVTCVAGPRHETTTLATSLAGEITPRIRDRFSPGAVECSQWW